MDFSLEAEQQRQFDNYVLHRSNRTMESMEKTHQGQMQYRAIKDDFQFNLSELSTGVLNDSQFVLLFCKSCPKDFFQAYEKKDGTSAISAIVIEEEGKHNLIFFLPGSKFFIEKKTPTEVELEKKPITYLNWDRVFLDPNGKKKPMKIRFGYGPEKKLHVGENYSKYFPLLWTDTTWDKIYCKSYLPPSKGPKLP